MTATSIAPQREATRAAARLSGLAGWALIAIAALHIAVFIPSVPWSDWFGGSLRTTDPDPESVAVFWTLPGGLAVPAILAGALMIRLARQRQRVGLVFALVLAVWAAFLVWLIGPSGFAAVFAPVGLLIAAAIVDRRS